MAGYFQLFAEPYVMTQGGPLQSTVSVLYFMYEEGFKWWNLGSASAVAFILFLLMFAVTMLQFWAARRWSRRMSRRWSAFLVNAALLAAAAVTLCPLLWMLSVSFMRPARPARFPPPFLPEHATPRATTARCSRTPAWAATSPTACSSPPRPRCCRCVFNVTAGYAFAKLRFAGRDRMFKVLLGALVIPAQVAMLPLFLMLKSMGLVNTYVGVLDPVDGERLRHLPGAPVRAVDPERAARGGAGRRRRRAAHLQVRSSLPALGPILVTLAIFTFLGTWNDFMWPLIVLTDDDLHTLPVALASLSREHVQDNELMMAGSVLTVLPVLLLFLVLQRYYIQGLLAGSVKG